MAYYSAFIGPFCNTSLLFVLTIVILLQSTTLMMLDSEFDVYGFTFYICFFFKKKSNIYHQLCTQNHSFVML